MNRLNETGGGRGDVARQVARLLTVLASACLIAWLLTSFEVGGRSSLFETVAIARAEAGTRADNDVARLRLLTRCVGYVRSNYVVPQRVKPLPMLVGALKAAEGVVADLMVTPDSDQPEKVRSIAVRVGDQQRTFDVSDVTDLYQMNWKLLDIFEYVSRYLPPDVKADDVEYAAINGLLSPLDEHSVYLPPRAYKEMQLDTQGRFGGLGIVITTRKGLVTVVSVLPGTPSSKAGLKAGDQILEIGDESTMNVNLSDAVGKLRGEPGTPVTILVQRKEWTEPRPFTLVRAEIHIQSVTSEALGDGIGYARLRHFQEDTSRELKRQLDDLKKRGSLNGLVLDLRQNPGGLLEQSVEVNDLFIRKGTLVVTESEGRRNRQSYEADGDAPFADLPVAVLVDGGSASAAEIVAGALKGDDRAPLIGETTFGKGTVQVMYEVGEEPAKGALKLTIAQYLTPGDISIQGVGVTPDLQLEPVSVSAAGRVNLGLIDERRERDPKRLLEAFGKIAHDTPSGFVPYLREDNSKAETDEDSDEEPPLRDEDRFELDDPIRLAATLVRGGHAATRSGLLKETATVLADWTAAQDVRITKALAEHGIDWTAGPLQPGAAVKVTWSMDKPQPLQAGGKVKLRLTAKNEGPDPLFRVHCTSDSENASLDAREFVFGRLPPGEAVTREVLVSIPRDSWDRNDQVSFKLYQADTEMARPDPVMVATRGLLRPRFAYSWQVQDPAGNADGQLNPGETASLLIDVMNQGEGAAQRVLVTLRNKSGEGVYVRDGRVTLRNGIPIGKSAQARFSLDLKRDLAPGNVTLEIGILDLAVREYLSEEITIPVGRPGTERFEARAEALRTQHNGVPVLAAAAEGAPALFEAPENFFLRSSGRRGDFFKVDLEEGRFAFVRVADVEVVHGVVRFSALPEAPVARFVQPAMDVRFQVAPGATEAAVSGQVRFAGHAGEARRKVLIFRGGDKLYFWTRRGAASESLVPVDAKIPLVKGRNDIAVYAIEGKDRSALRRFSVFSAGPAAAPGQAGASVGSGAGGAK